MTFEQNEFQNLTELVVKLWEQNHNDPIALEAIFSELKDLYKKVSIYPGIITMCLPKVIQLADISKLNGGEEVIFAFEDGEAVTGKVAEVTPEEIKLTPGDIAVKKTTVKEAKLVTRRILRKLWPTLDFGK